MKIFNSNSDGFDPHQMITRIVEDRVIPILINAADLLANIYGSEKFSSMNFEEENEASTESQVVIEESCVGVPIKEFKDDLILKAFQAIYGEEKFEAMKDEGLYILTI